MSNLMFYFMGVLGTELLFASGWATPSWKSVAVYAVAVALTAGYELGRGRG
jgi:hypothetical protein